MSSSQDNKNLAVSRRKGDKLLSVKALFDMSWAKLFIIKSALFLHLYCKITLPYFSLSFQGSAREDRTLAENYAIQETQTEAKCYCVWQLFISNRAVILGLHFFMQIVNNQEQMPNVMQQRVYAFVKYNGWKPNLSRPGYRDIHGQRKSYMIRVVKSSRKHLRICWKQFSARVPKAVPRTLKAMKFASACTKQLVTCWGQRYMRSK